MKRRCWIVGTFALWVSSTGCTGPMLQSNGPVTSRLKAWAEAPLGSPKQAVLAPERGTSMPETSSPVGLTKYFPGLRRDPSKFPEMAAAPRPPWYSFARRSTASSKPIQQYASDSRSSLSKGMTEAAVLPVSLQMPIDQVVDPAVNQTKGESFTVGQRPSPPAPVRVLEEEINPLPPAAEPAPPVVVNRMPNLPAVDPLQGPSMAPVTASPSDRPDPSIDLEGSKAAMTEEVNPLPPAAAAAPTVVVDRKPDPTPTPTVTTTTTTLAAAIETRKVDDQAVKAIPDEEETGDKTVLAEFLHKCILKVKKKHNHPTTVVMPTPQSDPKPKPVVQIAPKPKVVIQPTPQVKPSSQVDATAEDCSTTGCHHSSKKFCMRRLVRRMMHLGEFSDSSTVATH